MVDCIKGKCLNPCTISFLALIYICLLACSPATCLLYYLSALVLFYGLLFVTVAVFFVPVFLYLILLKDYLLEVKITENAVNLQNS